MPETAASPLPTFPELPADAVPAGEAPGVAQAVALGLTEAEHALIVEQIGREPSEVELAMFSLMWSEHCAYKHSKKLLRGLPTTGEAVLMGPGENAGAVAVGEDLAVAFKVESHNHPSAVEPFQGAATGVGGILRDIFALGARPIAVLDALRFGEVDDSERSRHLLDGAVRGIGHYGNSVGVPNVGGDVYFEEPYETNCLVNAMAVGLARRGEMIRCAATGEGNLVVLFGATTGRDGIGGASVLASAELVGSDAEGIGDKRPTVQVGDPFAEKKALECSLELLRRGLLVALQDLGAAGLTSSASEMASQGATGMDLDLDRVPRREAGLEPFEVMVSESQERMLCVCAPERLEEVLEVCAKWEIHGTAIGRVTDTRRMRIFAAGALVGAAPVEALVDDCPLYDLHPAAHPGGPAALYPVSPRRLADGIAPGEAAEDPGAVLRTLMGSANVADRRPLFQQYDCLVQSRTVRRPGDADAAVLLLHDEAPAAGGGVDAAHGGESQGGGPGRVASELPQASAAAGGATGEATDLAPGVALAHEAGPGVGGPGGRPGLDPSAAPDGGPLAAGAAAHPDARTGIGVSLDGSGRRVAADPYRGTAWNVLECAANLACVGARPLGLTNNLNFGNPEKPHIAWQLTESVRGLGDACRAIDAPVVGGNVSLYNEGTTGPIYPTPTVGLVGELPDVRRTAGLGFGRNGDAIALVGPFAPQLELSEVAKLAGWVLPDGLPEWDLERLAGAIAQVRDAVRTGALTSCHDVAEGGIAVALAESCLAGRRGATVDLGPSRRPWAAAFGEAPGGFVVSGEEQALRYLAGGDEDSALAVQIVGTVGGDRLVVESGGLRLAEPLDALRDAHAAGLARHLG